MTQMLLVYCILLYGASGTPSQMFLSIAIELH